MGGGIEKLGSCSWDVVGSWWSVIGETGYTGSEGMAGYSGIESTISSMIVPQGSSRVVWRRGRVSLLDMRRGMLGGSLVDRVRAGEVSTGLFSASVQLGRD